MLRILVCMCWQTENKTCLVYVLGIAQRCMFQGSSSSLLGSKTLGINELELQFVYIGKP